MNAWIKEPESYFPSMDEFKHLLDRLLRLSLPSMCVFKGNSMAVGYFLGLAHDFRIMSANHGIISLTELLFGGFLTPPLFALLKAKLSAPVVSKLHYALRIRPDEALKDRAIDSTFKDEADMVAQMDSFVNRYAALGVHRFPI